MESDLYYRIYSDLGELSLPHSERTYFDYASTEFTYNSKEQKLLDIGYLLWHGCDIKSIIHHTYSDAHPSVSENAVRRTLIILLAEIYKKPVPLISYGSRNKKLDDIIDEFLKAVRNYYHLPTGVISKHYLKNPLEMTEFEIRNCNPWRWIAKSYEAPDFLLSDKQEFVCADDYAMVKEFNDSVKEEYKYKLNVPVYPWYGNPLTAKVIVLSLNPGYVENESKIARVFQNLPLQFTKGYTDHLTSMLSFDCDGLLPEDTGVKGMTSRDLANIHQTWYWQNRLKSAFENEETGLTFEDINKRFAVLQFVGYSSIKYTPFKRNKLLPSQNYTRQLVEYILNNNPNTIFVVPRNERGWRKFLGELWDEKRFVVSPDYLGQRFTKKILGEDKYNKIITAFKS